MKYFLLLYDPRINNSLKTRRVNSAWHDTELVSYLGPKIGNHFHNISRLFDVLPNFLFPTSETMGHYYLETQYVRVASRVAERLKT